MIAGKYRVTRLIGEGGMASVYEATHVEIGRRFALKLLHPWLSSDEEWLERFQREACAGGSLESEHVAAILDAGLTDDEAPYILMELLHGEDLAQRLAREGTLKPVDAIEIVSQACLGLAVAHEAGVVHRDLKPENIFLCPRPIGGISVKVLDFGIAKLRNSQLTRATKAGMVMGTPFYMSPEQAGGRGNVDSRTDIYAMGVILYELLSGEKPFMAPDSNALLNQIVAGPTPLLQEQCPTLSRELADVVQRAIAKSPEARYQTAADFAEALIPFWPSSRRGALTAESLIESVRNASGGYSPQRTQAEPHVTVRVTGPRQALSALALAAPPKRRRVTMSGPPTSAEIPDFADLTEPDVELRDTTPEQLTAADSEHSEANKAPKRERVVAGRFRAPETLPPVSPTDETPAPTSVQTVSLGRTIAPVLLGAASIALLVVALTGAGMGTGEVPTVVGAVRPAVARADSPSASPQSALSEHSAFSGDAWQESVTLSGPSSIELTPPEAAAVDAGETASAADEEVAGAGLLTVRSDVPGKLWVGSRYLGKTPVVGVRLAAGKHPLVLAVPKAGEQRKTVIVRPDRVTVIHFDAPSAAGPETRAPTSTSTPTTSAPSASASSSAVSNPAGRPQQTDPRSGCNPRWFVDDEGVRRVKPECLLPPSGK